MELVYPYTIEIVPSKRVSTPRAVGSGVVVYDTLRVDLPLFRKSLPGLSSSTIGTRRLLTERILDEAKMLAFEKFVLFLQIVSEYQSSFPKELLRRSEERRFVVLLPTSSWLELRLRHNLLSPRRESLRTWLEEFELELLSHPRLADDEAYIVGRDKYRLYLHVHELRDELRVFRSDFLDVSTQPNAPIALRARNVLAKLFDDVERRSATVTAERTTVAASCPRCHGRLIYLALDEAFCLSCDWDNLKVLPNSRIEDL
jgi:hypothetical protein